MNRIYFKVWLLLICFVGLFPCGCDTFKDIFDIGYEQKDVLYTISGDQITHNADDESNYTSGTYVTKSLLWHCGNYKGQTKKRVNLTFEKTSGTWSLHHEESKDGDMCR
jgi:hypothetical protein